MEYKESEWLIRSLCEDEWEDAMGLAWSTFLKFEAPVYSEEGIRSFNDFVTDTTLYRMFIMGVYQVFGAFEGKKMIGMIALRSNSHISLLFVDVHYHRRGIGRKLVQYLCNYLMSEMGIYKVTVNASPYGVGFYHKLGFYDVEEETEKDGIIYTPMELVL